MHCLLSFKSLKSFQKNSCGHTGKLDLLTVSLRKLKFASVTDFSLSKLSRESFIIWGLKTAREQKNLLWISLDNYPKAEKGKNQIPE